MEGNEVVLRIRAGDRNETNLTFTADSAVWDMTGAGYEF